MIPPPDNSAVSDEARSLIERLYGSTSSATTPDQIATDAAMRMIEDASESGDGFGMFNVDGNKLSIAFARALSGAGAQKPPSEPVADQIDRIEQFQFLRSLQVGVTDCIGLDRHKLRHAKALRSRGYVTIADSSQGPMIGLTEDGAVAALDWDAFAATPSPAVAPVGLEQDLNSPKRLRQNWRGRRLLACRAAYDLHAVIEQLGIEDGSVMPPEAADRHVAPPSGAMRSEAYNAVSHALRLILILNDGSMSSERLRTW